MRTISQTARTALYDTSTPQTAVSSVQRVNVVVPGRLPVRRVVQNSSNDRSADALDGFPFLHRVIAGGKRGFEFFLLGEEIINSKTVVRRRSRVAREAGSGRGML